MISNMRLEAAIELVCEWKRSGLSQARFAAEKGIGVRGLEYQVKKVRCHAPEVLMGEDIDLIEFASVPEMEIEQRDIEKPLSDQPVLMIQYPTACLQVTNEIRQDLLKTALEVMKTC